jgi:DNA mismatch repair protein MutL
MPKIRVLSEVLASQVAAGEVVERPASVVKELVENSLDANAREIRVDIDRGGAGLIRVSDDGCGMSRDDAVMSLARHATSKLRSAGDLAAIRTLGFRGEAVPSIASVSRFRLVTREPDALVGTEILVDGGTVREVRDAGCAPGTVIEAKALFFNLPARRKFLRAETTEAAHIEHQLRLHALAAPGVRFRLRRDDREIFDLPPVARAADRVRQIIGTDLGRELIALPITRGPGISVEGFVLPAVHARKGRRHQFVFLNGRPVEDSAISRGLADGFRGGLADGLHPAAWLWIDLEPSLVDVNVHPAKREVRFHRAADVRDAVAAAVQDGLRSRSSGPISPPPLASHRPFAAKMATSPERAWPTRSAPPVISAPPAAWTTSVQQVLPAENPAADIPGAATEARPNVPTFRMLGMLHQRFVLLESEDGLVLFDPKAAKERILYERLARHADVRCEAQNLLVPVLLELDPRDLDLVLRERSALVDAGIEADAFGGNTLQIRSVPACLLVDDPRAFLGELMDELLHDNAPGGRFAAERLAKLLARRAAAQVIPRLQEALPLLNELFNCELPYCTPGGQPTLTEYSLREFERRFGNPGKP